MPVDFIACLFVLSEYSHAGVLFSVTCVPALTCLWFSWPQLGLVCPCPRAVRWFEWPPETCLACMRDAECSVSVSLCPS
jgi:hypothetical protein